MTGLQYIYEHRCPSTCPRQGQQVTITPPVHDGVVELSRIVCAASGTELYLVDVVETVRFHAPPPPGCPAPLSDPVVPTT